MRTVLTDSCHFTLAIGSTAITCSFEMCIAFKSYVNRYLKFSAVIVYVDMVDIVHPIETRSGFSYSVDERF